MTKKKVKFTKADIRHKVQLNEHEVTTDGDIFGMVREFQNMHERQNIEVENAAEIYRWIKEIRDGLNGDGKGKNKVSRTKRS